MVGWLAAINPPPPPPPLFMTILYPLPSFLAGARAGFADSFDGSFIIQKLRLSHWSNPSFRYFGVTVAEYAAV